MLSEDISKAASKIGLYPLNRVLGQGVQIANGSDLVGRDSHDGVLVQIADLYNILPTNQLHF